MFSNALVLLYIISCFAGLQAVTFIVIGMKHSDAGNTKLMKATRNFVLATLFVGIYYFFTYYRELVLGEFEANAVMRGLDSIQFYVMGLTWVKLVDAIAPSKAEIMTKWRKALTPVFAVLMALSAFTYIFLLDGMYRAKFPAGEVIVILGEVVLGVSVIVFTAVFVRYGFRELMEPASRKYLMTVSILVNFNNLWNNIIVVAVFLHAVELTLICSKLYGITAIALLVINLYSVINIYKKDFSPLYTTRESVKEKKHMTEEERLDHAAQQHRLTEREREVMILAYGGMTNPEIAEELFISRNTVKRHMHNIFEKLDVSTRVELIHLISSN